VLDALVAEYLANDTEILPVVRAMLLRDEFYSSRARSARVNPPAEFVVGTLRAVGARTNGRALPQYVSAMGQDLFNPPNVAGWPGDLAWMTSARQLQRFDFAWLTASARTG